MMKSLFEKPTQLDIFRKKKWYQKLSKVSQFVFDKIVHL